MPRTYLENDAFGRGIAGHLRHRWHQAGWGRVVIVVKGDHLGQLGAVLNVLDDELVNLQACPSVFEPEIQLICRCIYGSNQFMNFDNAHLPDVSAMGIFSAQACGWKKKCYRIQPPPSKRPNLDFFGRRGTCAIKFLRTGSLEDYRLKRGWGHFSQFFPCWVCHKSYQTGSQKK